VWGIPVHGFLKGDLQILTTMSLEEFGECPNHGGQGVTPCGGLAEEVLRGGQRRAETVCRTVLSGVLFGFEESLEMRVILDLASRS